MVTDNTFSIVHRCRDPRYGEHIATILDRANTSNTCSHSCHAWPLRHPRSRSLCMNRIAKHHRAVPCRSYGPGVGIVGLGYGPGVGGAGLGQRAHGPCIWAAWSVGMSISASGFCKPRPLGQTARSFCWALVMISTHRNGWLRFGICSPLRRISCHEFTSAGKCRYTCI